MVQIDNFCVISFIRQSLNIVSEGFFDFNQEFLLKRIDFGFMNEYMINSDAGLTTVEEFTENNSRDSVINVSSFINNDGAFTTKLKKTWSQVFSGFNGYKFTSFGRASETDEIKRQRGKFFGNINFSLDTSVIPLIRSEKYFYRDIYQKVWLKLRKYMEPFNWV